MTYDECAHPKCDKQTRLGVQGLNDSERSYCSDTCRVDDVYGNGETPIGAEEHYQ